MILHLGAGWGWLWEQLAANILEAVALAIIAAHISRLREERVIRRHRQVQYLNHHVRNALALMKMVEQQLEREQALTVHRASSRICTVVEQLTRDEDVFIDTHSPDRLTSLA